MKPDAGREQPAPVESAEQVLAFLHAHPGFLSDHPELLAAMRVPHPCGDAVSLIEHQVTVLRDQVRQLRRRAHEMASNARENEALGQRMHRLTLALVEAGPVDEAFAALYQGLGSDFAADAVTVRVFAAPREESDRRLGEFVVEGDAGPRLFASILGTGNPLCGHLTPARAEYLFADQGSLCRSAVVLPLGPPARGFGVLAIGSHDPERFRPGMGTVFLRNLSEVLGRVLRRHLAGD